MDRLGNAGERRGASPLCRGRGGVPHNMTGGWEELRPPGKQGYAKVSLTRPPMTVGAVREPPFQIVRLPSRSPSPIARLPQSLAFPIARFPQSLAFPNRLPSQSLAFPNRSPSPIARFPQLVRGEPVEPRRPLQTLRFPCSQQWVAQGPARAKGGCEVVRRDWRGYRRCLFEPRASAEAPGGEPWPTTC